MANKKLILRTLTSPFVGNAPDITRNSVLSHNDVDNNFIFLKGEDVLTATTTGTTVVLHKVNSDTIEVDLLPILCSVDNFTTGATLINSTVYFDTTDALSAYTVDLSPLMDDTNTFVTGTTLAGKTIYYDRNDALSAFTTDLSGIVPDADYGNIIFVSEVGPSGLTRTDVIGDINKPVDLQWASQIAQSGDTIHVKSGIYNVSLTGNTGLCVNGVNHHFENNSKVYKNTAGPMFGKTSGTTEANVFGNGSFYGSGSCGVIFSNNGIDGASNTQVYEWDICENSADSCYVALYSGDTILRGKRRIVSTGGGAILHNSGSISDSLTVDCPVIKSTTSMGLFFDTTVGTSGAGNARLEVNANEMLGASSTLGGLHIGAQDPSITTPMAFNVNANYINYVYNVAGDAPIDLNLNVPRIDIITNFTGTHLNVKGHTGWINGTVNGLVNLDLVDRCWGAGTFTLEATLNGEFVYSADTQGSSLVTSFAGNTKAFLKLQKGKPTPGPFQYDFVDGWFMSNAGGSMNFLGQWDIQNFWITQASGRINIPAGTTINIGPTNPQGTGGFGSTGETFNFTNTLVEIGGTIVERCDSSAPCNTTQSAQTYSNTLMFVNNWGEGNKPLQSTRVVYNGATIIVRDQNSQILTTNVTGGTVGVYSAGLNTNKLNTFQAEKEKRRISVTGTSASYTVNGETFTSTTGATAADSAAELVALTNASGTLDATASQDNPGVDEYIYIESDIAGEELVLSYGTATAFNVIIRYNTKAITDIVGGTIIEDGNIIRDQYN